MTGGFSHLTKLLPLLSVEPDIEIIIIDNNSRDGTINYLANHSCTVRINKDKKSFSASNNQGRDLARGEYLLFLNNDTVITPGFTKVMQETFLLDEKIGIVGCLLYNMESPKKIQHIGVCFNEEYVPYELGQTSQVSPSISFGDPRVKAVRPVPSVTAACMMVKRDVFDAIGGFDEEYLNGWEDTDFVLRARELGYKVWYNGNAVVYHKHFGSTNAGRMAHEQENRQRYDDIWVHTGRAKTVLGDFREA